MSKKSASSMAGRVQLHQEGSKDIAPPEIAGALSDHELELYNAITRTKANMDWTEFHLTVAVQLARVMANIHEAEQDLKREGSVIFNQRGTPVANPLFSVYDTLTRQQMALMRTLGLTSVVGTEQKGQVAERAAKANNGKKSNLTLLASPE